MYLIAALVSTHSTCEGAQFNPPSYTTSPTANVISKDYQVTESHKHQPQS